MGGKKDNRWGLGAKSIIKRKEARRTGTEVQYVGRVQGRAFTVETVLSCMKQQTRHWERLHVE